MNKGDLERFNAEWLRAKTQFQEAIDECVYGDLLTTSRSRHIQKLHTRLENKQKLYHDAVQAYIKEHN